MFKDFFVRFIFRGIHALLWMVYVQLAMSFVYIPILVYWGLPVSYMGVVGNIIFAPFLFVFLLFSCLIFLTTIMGIPDGFLCVILQYVTHWWITLLSCGSQKWLIGFACPGVFWLVVFVLCGSVALWFVRRWRLWVRVSMLSGILVFMVCVLKYAQHVPHEMTIMYHKTTLRIENNNNQLTLIIPRVTMRENGFAHWFSRVLTPQLYKTFGQSHIHTVKLLNPTEHAQKIVHALQLHIGYDQIESCF